MHPIDISGTKLTLFNNSVNLFAEKGYTDVSIRDIAAATGIQASSIYYYFKSKKQILEQIYAYYDYYHNDHLPSLEEMFSYIEKETPKQVLYRTIYQYDPTIRDTMSKIFVIISTQSCNGDLMATEIINKNISETPKLFTRSILEKMIELKKIKTLDIDSFLLLLNSLYNSYLWNTRINYDIEFEAIMKAVELLFSLIEETDV